MNLFNITKGIDFYKDKGVREGLRLRMDKDVDPYVKIECKKFCKWLRCHYCFPIRISVYIKSSFYVKALDGDFVSATFLGPFDKMLEPYIRISAGDYYKMLNESSSKNAALSILHSIAHEIVHYYQWINDLELSSRIEEWQASFYATKIIDKYMRDCLEDNSYNK